MKFQGKIGVVWWLALILMLKATVDTLNAVNTGSLMSMLAAGIVIIVYTGCVHMTLKNYVLLEESTMTVYLGIFKTTIPYKELLSVKKTKNPLASMAISFDRLEIRARKTSVIIAVKDKPGLVKELIKRNPKIETTPDLL